MDRGVLRLPSASTAFYTAILDKNGDCKFGIGDFNIHDELTVDRVNSRFIREKSFYFTNISFKKR